MQYNPVIHHHHHNHNHHQKACKVLSLVACSDPTNTLDVF